MQLSTSQKVGMYFNRNYERLRIKAGFDSRNNLSVLIFSEAQKTLPYRNTVLDSYDEMMEARAEFEAIVEAIGFMNRQEAELIIAWDLDRSKGSFNPTNVIRRYQEKYQCSEITFFRHLKQAREKFAQIFTYRNLEREFENQETLDEAS